MPAARLDDELPEEGLAFDGSSVRGWKSIDKSDMNIKPDPESAFIDPSASSPPSASSATSTSPAPARYDRDPRPSFQGPELPQRFGIGDMAFFGLEPEFFVFDGIRYSSDPSGAFYEIDRSRPPDHRS